MPGNIPAVPGNMRSAKNPPRRQKEQAGVFRSVRPSHGTSPRLRTSARYVPRPVLRQNAPSLFLWPAFPRRTAPRPEQPGASSRYGSGKRRRGFPKPVRHAARGTMNRAQNMPQKHAAERNAGTGAARTREVPEAARTASFGPDKREERAPQQQKTPQAATHAEKWGFRRRKSPSSLDSGAGFTLV